MHYIVIPEGIAADKNGRPLPKPSFVYRQILDYTLHIVRDGDTIYLAPANSYGGKSEHELGYEYIRHANRREVMIYCPEVTYNHYIDTLGNALHLRKFLQKTGDERITFDLVCAYLHSYRASYCFRKQGFKIRCVHRVFYHTENENIVSRWWYYKYKPLHILYETAAFLRDIMTHCVAGRLYWG